MKLNTFKNRVTQRRLATFLLLLLPVFAMADSISGAGQISTILQNVSAILSSHIVLAIAAIAVAGFGYMVLFRGFSSITRLGQVVAGVAIIEAASYLVSAVFGS